jgi:thioredoxin 1
MALELTDKNFDEVVMASDKPVLVDMWAIWCGPCRMVAPIMEDISKEYAGRIIVGKLDVDSNPVTTSRFGIRNIPTILFFKDGKVVDKQVGAVPKAVIIKKLEPYL